MQQLLVLPRAPYVAQTGKDDIQLVMETQLKTFENLCAHVAALDKKVIYVRNLLCHRETCFLSLIHVRLKFVEQRFGPNAVIFSHKMMVWQALDSSNNY